MPELGCSASGCLAVMPQRLDDILRLFVRATIDNHRDNPRLHRVLFEEAPRAPAFLARLHELEQLSVETIVRLLSSTRTVRASGRLRAHIVVATVDSPSSARHVADFG